jgi:hypothetical protein
MITERPMSSQTPSGTRPWQLILAWGLVGLPLLWGVLQTVRAALKLFNP